MAGTIEIINRALSKLGERRINSLNDNVKAAAEAASLYDIVRDAEIAAHRWGFAHKRNLLPQLADPPLFGYRYAYLLPVDCLRVLSAGITQVNDYALEDGKLLTDTPGPLPLLYLARITDASKYPAPFIEALAAKLAVEMAEALTGSTTKREAAWKEYSLTLNRAKRWGAIQLPPKTAENDTWATAREI